jgi:hypothetical protein
MNNLLRLWAALIKDACSKYAETHGILKDQQDGFRLLRSTHDELASIIMMMEDAKVYNKDMYIMYADFKIAFNAADHRIMFKHMRQLGMPPTFVDTCDKLYGVYHQLQHPLRPHPVYRHQPRHAAWGQPLPFLFTRFLEPFLRWLTVGSIGYRPGAPTTYANLAILTHTYPGHEFGDDRSLATGTPTNMTIPLKKLSLFSEYT